MLLDRAGSRLTAALQGTHQHSSARRHSSWASVPATHPAEIAERRRKALKPVTEGTETGTPKVSRRAVQRKFNVRRAGRTADLTAALALGDGGTRGSGAPWNVGHVATVGVHGPVPPVSLFRESALFKAPSFKSHNTTKMAQATVSGDMQGDLRRRQRRRRQSSSNMIPSDTPETTTRVNGKRGSYFSWSGTDDESPNGSTMSHPMARPSAPEARPSRRPVGGGNRLDGDQRRAPDSVQERQAGCPVPSVQQGGSNSERRSWAGARDSSMGRKSQSTHFTDARSPVWESQHRRQVLLSASLSPVELSDAMSE